jgi:hypothetical protein
MGAKRGGAAAANRARETAKVAAERGDAEWLDTEDVGTSRPRDVGAEPRSKRTVMLGKP